ncbi:hypothetical protein [Streptomyces flaveolus]|uniref:hypothetical protein n=1 Tax=Streptomyces flaveolus TaxID=67297 RepID=UPI0036FA4501
MSIVIVLEQAGCLSREHEGRVLGQMVELVLLRPRGQRERAGHPIDLGSAQRQLACIQWAVPALTGRLVVLNALHGEQQRPMAQLPGMWEHAGSSTPLAPRRSWAPYGRTG